MEYDLAKPVTGLYPYRFTQDDRFQYRVKAQPIPGHVELSIRCVDTRLAANAARRQWEGCPKRGNYVSEAADPADSIRRSKLRAKSMVRLLALHMAIDRMFTFTIRFTGTPLEYDKVVKAWDYFRRSMEKAFPGFKYLATPEKQKNGQWHIHAGTHGFLNVNVLRKLWQAALNRVMGRSLMLTSGSDSPGHVHVGTRGKLMGSALTKATKIALYISKYIGKAMDVALNRKKYFHSYGVEVTPAQRKWLEANTRDRALMEVLRDYGLLDTVDGVEVPVEEVRPWFRDSNSVWLRVPIQAMPPPF